MTPKRLGIVVGGGPAPGINAVIGAATIEAVNQGFQVYGFFDGLRWLSGDGFDAPQHSVRLDINRVARIHFEGGSILRTSRTSLIDNSLADITPDSRKLQHVIQNLGVLGIKNLITIGGDDTALSARFIQEAGGERMHVVHVPKTIDNDLPLPHDTPTFGFSSARYLGTKIVKNLMTDSQTTRRWYIVTAMGRSAGWLALGIGQSAGATMTLIPEEFPERITVQHLADVLEGAILKRRAMGRYDGVIVLAEGLAYRLGDRDELARLLGRDVPVDAAGHPRLSEVPLGDLLKRELQSRFAGRGEPQTLVTKMLGYELRSAEPTPGDSAYCRTLGHGCIRMLMNGNGAPRGAMVTIADGNLVPMPFEKMMDPATQRMAIRLVDVSSHTYRVARAYMIRLEKSDFDNPEMLAKMAAEAQMTPDEFREYFKNAAQHLQDGVPILSSVS